MRLSFLFAADAFMYVAEWFIVPDMGGADATSSMGTVQLVLLLMLVSWMSST